MVGNGSYVDPAFLLLKMTHIMVSRSSAHIMQNAYITDPDYFPLARSSFFRFCSLLWYWYTGGMRIVWLVCTVDSKTYLRVY